MRGRSVGEWAVGRVGARQEQSPEASPGKLLSDVRGRRVGVGGVGAEAGE